MAAEEIILIIEDEDPQRIGIQIDFESRGLSVRGVKNVQDAREAFKELGEELAVMVLDMRLDDPQAPGVTGADLGLEVRAGKLRRLPEFLILSGHSQLEYYQRAIRLSVAAYLSKEDTSSDQLIRHVRALLIRRNLSVDDHDVSRRIAQIAEKSQSVSEATAGFCSEILAPVLSRFLGAPHIILLGDGHSILAFQNGAKAPQELQPIYEKVEMAIYAKMNASEPFVIDSNILLEITGDDIDAASTEGILGAVFLPLPFGHEIRLSIGILPSDQPLAEAPKELALILSHYLHRSVLETLFYMLEQHLNFRARLDAAQSLAYASSCIADDQLAILSDAVGDKEIRTDSESFRRLMSLSEELRDTGQTLMMLEGERSEAAPEPIEICSLVLDVLEDLDVPLLKDRDIVRGDCLSIMPRDDLFIALSRVIQWFAQRLEEHPSSKFHIICEETPEGASVTFEDSSPQLPLRLRQRLFSPFAQPAPAAKREREGVGRHFPLYLAKVLVELKHGGKLEDRSDELPENLGHKFAMSLPTSF